MLTKLLLVLYLVTIVYCVFVATQNAKKDTDLEDLITDIFGDDNNQIDRQCGQVDGSLVGCNECYPCNHSAIRHYQSRDLEIHHITLIDSKCSPTPVCCVSGPTLLQRFGGAECGRRVETGRPRVAPRLVLPGEYPWYAFLYRKVDKDYKLLCQASLIDDGARALLTTASCLAGVPPSRVFVGWDMPPAGLGHMARVQRVIPHPDFDKATKVNDIALVTLSVVGDIAGSAREACLPLAAAPPRPGLSCHSVGINDYQIKMIIPRKKLCQSMNGNRPLHPSQMCATTVGGGDFLPRPGSSLACETSQVDENDVVYVTYGLASYSKSDSVTIFTNITHFQPWIAKNL